MSIIREVMSNCYDSHVMFGNRALLTWITAPTLEHPHLIFRDHGVGLTPEEAETTIFEFLGSAKDDSDEFIGGWGLGSKSPFAYTDTFTTILYKDGHRWEYELWKDEDGMPNKACFSDEPTSESNGVEVRIPIATKDVYACCAALRSYLYRTRFPFQLTNDSSLFVAPTCETLWERVVNDRTVSIVEHDASKIFIYYGGFTYNVEDIDWAEEDKALIALWKGCLRDNQALYLHANVGDCTFSVSRETLSGTEKTFKWVMGQLRALGQYIDENALQHVEKHLKPLFDKFVDEKTGRPVKDSLLRDVLAAQNEVGAVGRAEDNSEIFRHFSFHNWVRKLSHNDGAFFTTARNSNSDMFRTMLNTKLNTDPFMVQYVGQKKQSDAQSFFRHIQFRQNGSRSSKRKHRDWQVKVGHISYMDVNLTEMLNLQITLLWTPHNLSSKSYADLDNENSHKRPPYLFVIRAPNVQAARAFADHAGFIGIPVTAFEDNTIGLERAENVARARTGSSNVVAPTFVQCQSSCSRHEYYVSSRYYYLGKGMSHSDLKGANFSWNKGMDGQIFQPSSTFLKKYAGKLDNVIEITLDNWAEYINFDYALNRKARTAQFGGKSWSQLHNLEELAESFEDYHPALLQAVGINPVKLARTAKVYCEGSSNYSSGKDNPGLEAMIKLLGLKEVAIADLPSHYSKEEMKAAQTALNKSEWVKIINWEQLKKSARETKLRVLAEALKELSTIANSATTGAV